MRNVKEIIKTRMASVMVVTCSVGVPGDFVGLGLAAMLILNLRSF